MREECTMWRSAFIILLLASSPALSPALAGQASATIQVGITITGPAQPAKAKASSSDPQTPKRSVQTRTRPPKPQ